MNRLRRLHEDEEGMESLQIVMIVAIAGVIFALVRVYWVRIRVWYRSSVDSVVRQGA